MEAVAIIPEQLLLLVIALYVLGTFLKYTQKVADKYIPMLLLVIGIMGSMALQHSFSTQAMFEGIVATGIAVMGNQIYKQIFNE